eukprot:COSAG05_NODE_4503_length_1487_cov_1.832853_2_plen_90_part_00
MPPLRHKLLIERLHQLRPTLLHPPCSSSGRRCCTPAASWPVDAVGSAPRVDDRGADAALCQRLREVTLAPRDVEHAHTRLLQIRLSVGL